MKDFHDVWALSCEFAFDGTILRAAVAACFQRRQTAWTSETPDAPRPAFYEEGNLAAHWSNYIRAGAFRVAPPAAFGQIGQRVIAFLGPVRDSLVNDSSFEKRWDRGGTWS